MGRNGCADRARGALVFVSGRPGARAPLAVTMLSIGLLAPLPVVARAQVAGSFGDAPRLVILGLDSLSHADDLSTLRAWVRRERGAWYERAVTPGLLTNAVWASIMTGRPISDHGVFETFQSLTPESATLIREASAQGYRTVSFFPDQLTCAVGSEAGFDRVQSGPVGWRQLVLPIVANSSILVPLVKPLLPDWFASPPISPAPSLTASNGRCGRLPRPAAATSRLLQPGTSRICTSICYPASFEMTRHEFMRVWQAPTARLRHEPRSAKRRLRH